MFTAVRCKKLMCTYQHLQIGQSDFDNIGILDICKNLIFHITYLYQVLTVDCVSLIFQESTLLSTRYKHFAFEVHTSSRISQDCAEKRHLVSEHVHEFGYKS